MRLLNILIHLLLSLSVLLLSKTVSGCGSGTIVKYEMVERGTVNGRAFERCRTLKNVTVEEWAETIKSGHQESIVELYTYLSESPFSAFYFETPPVRDKDEASTQPFELVLVDAPRLAKRSPRFKSFLEPCSQASTSDYDYFCVFPNLSGDATLIVPTPINYQDQNVYTHLANFVRKAPDSQIESLFQSVATEYLKHISYGRSAVWLSTAGNGVPWLHFRLDKQPKYYRYSPYKDENYHQIASSDRKLTEEL